MAEKFLPAVSRIGGGTVWRTSRMATTMSGRLFLVNETVLRRLLKAGLVDVDVVEGVFLFPFRLEVVDVDATAGHGLALVYRLPSVEALTICFSPICC